MSALFTLSKTSSLARSALVGAKLLAKNTNAFNTSLAASSHLCPQVQVRTSTKKAAGSKTHMKDSAGRRLGAKKNEGQLVKTGEIIYRQRGTKIYPGENCDIGRDHTIYAKEPGFVRYYLDPFHPKRKFVGVALAQDLRLPTDHWAPRVRRFGYVEITNAAKAQQEEEHLSRKDWVLKQQLEAEIKQREAKRQQRKQELSKQFAVLAKDNGKQFSEEESKVIAERLLAVERYVKNGFSTSEASKNVTFNQLYDYKLALKRKEIDETKYNELVQQYKSLAEYLDANVSQDWKYDLVKKLSDQEVAAKKQESVNKLNELTKLENLPLKADAKKAVSDLIFKSHVFSKSEIAHMKRKYLKPVLPESVAVLDKPAKKSVAYKRYDYELNKVVTVSRSKDAFLAKVK